MSQPRLLIEEWLPARALGVECMRERGSASALAPTTFLHVWWARRPLAISRAAVLGSLLPADFDRATFERLLGFYGSAEELTFNQDRVELARLTGNRIRNPHGPRAFSNTLPEPLLEKAAVAMQETWNERPTVMDPMAGGGSIPLEAARLGVRTLANEYNPVACSVEEVTLDYPFRHGRPLAQKARTWARKWVERFGERMAAFYQSAGVTPAYTFIFARTVPCPDTGHPTPLVPDWSLSRARNKPHLVANPVRVNKETGAWTIEVRRVGKEAGDLARPPAPTYSRGKGWSLFTRTEIPSDYIKAMAQQGRMGSHLYAVVTKAAKMDFRPPEEADYRALAAAEAELARLRPAWERDGIIPTEEYPELSSDMRPRLYGMTRWADLFAPRQLLALGVLVEELRALRTEIVAQEGEELGEAVVHLLAFGLDKFVNHNCIATKWECTRGTVKGKFDRHDYAFKATFAEMAACVAGAGLEWAIDNVLDAYEKLCALPRAAGAAPVQVTQGSATSLPHLADGSVTAVVVDPPYADNVQYSELADFFYVWLKRTQGHRRPEWFWQYLTEHDQEAVVNLSRHREDAEPAKKARAKAQRFYQRLMTEVFREAHRVLRDDGVLTVMFTHKQQSAWANLFRALIRAGFTITATWPVMTESQHSLHQARKNAAQSTVVLVARKREEQGEGVGYYDELMRGEIQRVAQETAARLEGEGLNRVDQLVGAFGPAMEVFSRYREVRTTTGDPVSVSEAIQVAADAVFAWRERQHAQDGLEGLDAESRFVHLCWDVLQAEQFRFNEAMLLGRSVGMDISELIAAGLLAKSGSYIQLRSAHERRRDEPVQDMAQLELFQGQGRRRGRRGVHPADAYFASAIDMCHALALRYLDAGGEQAGIGAARGMALQQGWDAESDAARLMASLVRAAPEGVRFPGKGRTKTAADRFPEFRAWHALLKPLFGIEPPAWEEPVELQPKMM